MILRLSLITVIFLFCNYAYSEDADLDYGSGNSSFFNFYQKWISPIKSGNTCPMHPSCSQYSKISFEKNNFVSAYVNTFSRLMECGRDRKYYSNILINNRVKCLDLPENYELQMNSLHDTIQVPVFDINTEIADSLMDNSYYNLAEKYYLLEYYNQKDLYNKKKYLLKYLKTCFYTKNASQYYPEFMKYRSLFKDDTVFSTKLKLITGANLFRNNEFEKCYQVLSYEEFSDETDEQIRKKLVLASIISDHDWSNLEYEIKNNSVYTGFSEFQISAYSRQIDEIPLKDPKTAYWMSMLIPGSGYFYAGRKSTGFAAAILNGLWIWTSYELFDNEFYAAGTTVSAMCLGWYFGAAKGSAKAVRKYNKIQDHQLAKKFLGNFNIYSLFKSISLE